jgi:hypothetical protein
MVCPTILGCFDLFLHFAPSRLGVSDSSWDWVAEVSRKDATALRFETEIRSFDVSLLFAPSRLGEKDSSWDWLAEVSRKGAKALRFESEIRPFDVSLLFAPLRLGVSNRISCIESDRPAIAP